MRITNSMMRSNVLFNINRNEQLLNQYDTQMASGKKIQKPSDNPIVAVRALKLRANVSEIKQYKTNAEDAASWLEVTEQSISNAITMLKRARDLCVQGANGIYSVQDRDSIVTELEQLKIQLSSEANVNYAGRFVFTGYKTDVPLTYTKDTTENPPIVITMEKLTPKDIETISKVVVDESTGNAITQDVMRIRLPYQNMDQTLPPSVSAQLESTTPPFVIQSIRSTDVDAYEPAENTIHYLYDTGELIFNTNNVTGTASPTLAVVPAEFDLTFTRSEFKKGDLVTTHYFGEAARDQKMTYQISYNQEIQINSLGKDIFTVDLMRDFDEIINMVKNVGLDDSVKTSMEKDVMSRFFGSMLTKLDNHLDKMTREESVVRSKINRLELTISRLDDDKINFTELLSINEDIDATETLINLRAQEIIYNASLMSSSNLLQQSLLDFLR